MPFPISSSGSISVPADSPDSLRAVTLAIEASLRKAKATCIRTTDDTISFRAGDFGFVFGWTQLLDIGPGEIRPTQEASAIKIHYHISFVKILISVSLMTAFLFALLGNTSGWSMLLTWLGLFGTNYLGTLYRFPRFLRAAAEKRHLHPQPPD